MEIVTRQNEQDDYTTVTKLTAMTGPQEGGATSTSMTDDQSLEGLETLSVSTLLRPQPVETLPIAPLVISNVGLFAELTWVREHFSRIQQKLTPDLESGPSFLRKHDQVMRGYENLNKLLRENKLAPLHEVPVMGPLRAYTAPGESILPVGAMGHEYLKATGINMKYLRYCAIAADTIVVRLVANLNALREVLANDTVGGDLRVKCALFL